MNVKVIDVLDKLILLEFTDAEGLLQRRLIDRGLFPVVQRGPATCPDDLVAIGLEYSDVDLEATLGPQLPAIQTHDLEQAFRKAGLWRREDYLKNSRVVDGVWQKLRGVDVAIILQAVATRLTSTTEE